MGKGTTRRPKQVSDEQFSERWDAIFDHGRLTDDDCAEIAEILGRPNQRNIADYRAELADGLEREAVQMQKCGEPGWANLAREAAIQLRESK